MVKHGSPASSPMRRAPPSSPAGTAMRVEPYRPSPAEDAELQDGGDEQAVAEQVFVFDRVRLDRLGRVPVERPQEWHARVVRLARRRVDVRDERRAQQERLLQGPDRAVHRPGRGEGPEIVAGDRTGAAVLADLGRGMIAALGQINQDTDPTHNHVVYKFTKKELPDDD